MDAAVTVRLPPGTSAAVDAATGIQEHFPGSATAACVAVTDLAGPELDAAVGRLHQAAADFRGRLLEPITVTEVAGVAIVRVPLGVAVTDPEADEALAHLREEVLPAVFGASDFTEQLQARTLYAVALILLLAFALLALTFRSWAIPLVSIALNLLSIGAACGALAWVFRDGHLEEVLGFTSYGRVVSWVRGVLLQRS